MFQLTSDDLRRKTDAELDDLFDRACHATAATAYLSAAFEQASNALRMICEERTRRRALRPGHHL